MCWSNSSVTWILKFNTPNEQNSSRFSTKQLADYVKLLHVCSLCFSRKYVFNQRNGNKSKTWSCEGHAAFTRGGVLNFGLGRDVRHEGPNIGSCWADQWQTSFWGLVELIFWTNWSLSELIFGPNLGFLNWILANFQAWEHEKLPNLGIFSGKFENFVIFG